MGKELYNTPFSDPACPTPDPAGGTLGGQTGGYDYTDMPKETPNMSELGLNRTGPLSVKDGPAAWSTVAVEPGVASPAVPTGNIDKG